MFTSILYASIDSAKIFCIYRWVWGMSVPSVRAACSEGLWTKAGDRCTNTPVTSPSPSDVFAALSAQTKSGATRGKWSSWRIRCIISNKIYCISEILENAKHQWISPTWYTRLKVRIAFLLSLTRVMLTFIWRMSEGAHVQHLGADSKQGTWLLS